MNIELLYDIYKQYPVITTDTRHCPQDSIFFALKGANFNGNIYAKQALQQGCCYAIVDEASYATDENIILVEDVLKTLQQLANYHRSKFSIPVIGITGTNGKTTTKELVSAVLSKQYKVLFTQGNLNNHIGVPLTLLQLNEEHEVAVIEMGANHVGEIKILSEIADPNLGLITNVGQAHLEGFGSFENIIKTKGELYDYLRKRKEGKVFMDYDNNYLRNMSEGLSTIYYGFEEDLFVSGKIVEMNPYLKFDWKFVDTHYTVQSQLIGDYNLANALAAISIGPYLGVKSECICEAIEEYLPNNNRSQLKKTDRNTLIIDAYNANPTSMKAALENFSQMEGENKSLILGEMKELGENSKKEHEEIVRYIASHNFKHVFLVGQNFENIEKRNMLHFSDVDSLNQYLIQNPLKDQYILIKGSRGVQLEKCINVL